MKKILSILLIAALIIGCTSMSVSAESIDSINSTGQNNSENIIEEELFEEEKVQKFNSFMDGAEAVQEIVESNSEMFSESIENCVIVRTSSDIVFDTSNVVQAVRYNGIYYIQYTSVQNAQEAIEAFQEYPTVEYAVADEEIVLDDIMEPVTEVSSSQDSNGYIHYSWGVIDTKADVFADYVSKCVGNQSVTVAVVDTGVDSSHPFLSGKILSNGYDYYNNDANPMDDNGHGTHVAGTIVDCTQGLNVNILPVKVLGANGRGTVSTVANGIYYAVNAGADVINLSLSAPEGSSSQIHIDFAVSEASNQNISVVASSGNDYSDTAYYCPAHRSDVIVTAAIDMQHNNMHGFNVRGEEYGSNYGTSVDVTAPGVDVISSVPYSINPMGYASYTGTSMAAPHISAAVAMLKLLYPSAPANQIQSILKSCASDLGVSGYDITYGEGLPILSELITNLPFYDVQTSDWYYDVVLDVYTRGYMTGKGYGEYFGVMENIMRNDVAVLVYRMAGSPAIVYRSVYPDVKESDYFANAAVWAYDSGIITGMNGNLGTGLNICRQDFAVVLYRFADYMGLDVSNRGNIDGYIDSSQVSSYAREAVEWAVGIGLMGQSVTTLNPVGFANRAEIAAMISRFLQVYNL